ncbi:MAG: SpoIIE family protein phosphatase [Acidobacteriota bacterium]
MSTETMSSARRESVSAEHNAWEKVFSLAKREADDRLILQRELERWCAGRETDAALYTQVAGGFELLASVGETAFPPQVVTTDELDSSWTRLELPQTLLVQTGEPDAGGPADAALLLAAGARISSLKRQIQEQHFQAKFRGVELQALYDVGLAIASTLDLEELCEEALLRAVSLLDARRGALYLLETGRYRLTSRFGGAALEQFEADEQHITQLLASEDGGGSEWIPGASHLLAVPVEIESNARGLLVVADKESRRGVGPFPATDRRTLLLFANQAAIAIENAKLHKLALEKERLEREMELAAEIQQQLLPKTMPKIAGYEVIGWNRPARQAGGDYYDFQHLENGGWGLVVGDVVGKGVPAAILVSTLHSSLRVLLDQMEVGPPLIERLNRHIFESSSANKFITMLLAALDTESHRLAYLNAGHNPGLLVRANGDVEEMTSAGLPLGLLPQGHFGSATLELESGDLVCIYSDGITECEAPDEVEFGLARLQDLLHEHRKQPLPEVLHLIDKAVTDFARGLPQGDDQTVILLRRR